MNGPSISGRGNRTAAPSRPRGAQRRGAGGGNAPRRPLTAASSGTTREEGGFRTEARSRVPPANLLGVLRIGFWLESTKSATPSRGQEVCRVPGQVGSGKVTRLNEGSRNSCSGFGGNAPSRA